MHVNKLSEVIPANHASQFLQDAETNIHGDFLTVGTAIDQSMIELVSLRGYLL